MKLIKYVFILTTLMVLGCKKEEKVCNCGLVVSDNGTYLSVDIKNSCSGNVKTFYLNANDWTNAVVGQDYCITNVTNW